MKNILIVLVVVLLVACSATKEVPLTSGEHSFIHKFAEHPHLDSIDLTVRLEGSQITIINTMDSPVFPKGILEQGELFWHQKTGKWAIVHSQKDKDAAIVGNCSDGPNEVDLINKIYWTC